MEMGYYYAYSTHMKQDYTYFEIPPDTGRLDDATYETAARLLGRPCLDILFIIERKLVLVNRTVLPMKGVWVSGGRIVWSDFKSPLQYAATTAKRQFNIEVTHETMHLLTPRFVCFKERPYPEILTWVAIDITPALFQTVSLNTSEQDGFVTFHTRAELITYLQKNNTNKVQASLVTDLYDELIERNLISESTEESIPVLP